MTPDEMIQLNANKGIYGTIEPPTGEALAQIFSLDFSFSPVISVLKIIAIIITVILIGFYIWFFIRSGKDLKAKTGKLSNILNPPEPAKDSIKNRWEEVTRHFTSFREGEWKFAIIEADKLVDDVLKEAGFEGETIGDRIKGISHHQLQSINQLKAAHRLRNIIAHDITFKVKYTDIRHAIEQYKKVLQELGALS